MTSSDTTIDHRKGKLSGHDLANRAGRFGRVLRFALAGIIVLGAIAASSIVMVGAGQAIIITKFGDPVRILTAPGLAWKLPAPLEGTIPLDLRLKTTSCGLQDVGTKDGLRILVQAYVAWQVPDDPDRIRQFLRAVRNDPDEAARQLRSFVGSALQVTASNFDLTSLVNSDPAKVSLGAFEQRLQANVSAQVLSIYGITIRQVGVERLSLPAETLAATVARMRAERETVAAERTAEGRRIAAEIRADATRDARIIGAKAKAEAAEIEAASAQKAAEIYAHAYALDPQLYTTLRSLDTINAVVGAKTHLILRTDAAPFNVLVQGPPVTADPGTPNAKAKAPAR